MKLKKAPKYVNIRLMLF